MSFMQTEQPVRPLRVINVMLGAKRGGVEQAAVDYCKALQSLGHDASAIVRANAAIIPTLHLAHIPFSTLAMPHGWNPLARRALRKLAKDADILIVHGNRPGTLTARIHGLPPVVAVAHSRFFKPLGHFAGIITMTQQSAETMRTRAACPVYVLPNMVDLPAEAARAPWRTPPVIGCMGRFSHEKGYDLLLDALAILTQRGIAYKAVIGGDGAEAETLRTRAAAYGIAPYIEWLGWVRDKAHFYDSIDLYCMSSRSETFPLGLLEAMAHSCPIVSTDCGGPAAILEGDTGILTRINGEAIADGLMRALADPAASTAMGTRAHSRAARTYATPVVARTLADILLQTADTALHVPTP